VAWIDRLDERNQRRAERDNERFQIGDSDSDTTAAEATASCATFLPGWLGAIGFAVLALAGALRLRRRAAR